MNIKKVSKVLFTIGTALTAAAVVCKELDLFLTEGSKKEEETKKVESNSDSTTKIEVVPSKPQE